MHLKKCIIACSFILLTLMGYGQDNPSDTLPPVNDQSLAMDTSIDYEGLMDELGDFLDSLLAPRSFLLVNVSAANGYFNYKNNAGTVLFTKKKFVFSPAIGYYHKWGPGITWSGHVVQTLEGLTLFQQRLTPSFDFVQSRKWLGGVAYTRFFTKDSLRFYTTPLQNEFNGYFLWRKSWIEPGITLSYGWGSRSDFKKREREILALRSRTDTTVTVIPPIIITTTSSTEESISDFSVTASLRHSFYWLQLSESNDYLKFTPMLTFTAGTQRYGFNQTIGSYAIGARNTAKVDYTAANVKSLDNELKFQPLALTLYLRPEYSIGKFFIMPQLILDYYFPGSEKRFTAFFSVNAGFMF